MIRTMSLSLAIFGCCLYPISAQEAADAVSPEAQTSVSVFDGLSGAVQTALDAKTAGRPVVANDAHAPDPKVVGARSPACAWVACAMARAVPAVLLVSSPRVRSPVRPLAAWPPRCRDFS